MNGVKRCSRCRSCGSEKIVPVLDLGDQVVSDFPKSRRAAINGPRVPIRLQLCHSCTLVQSEFTAPQDFLYTRHYWYRSGTTDTMRRALANVVESALNRVHLNLFDTVLDIGANDGTLLQCYPPDAKIFKIGVEPASNIDVMGTDAVIKDFWGVKEERGAAVREVEKYSAPKIVTACGMFYDLDDPNTFVRDVARVMHSDGIFVAQFMGLRQTVENNDIGNLAHEHLEFYSLRSIFKLFERHGLDVVDVESNDVNGGSYRVFARHTRNHGPIPDGATERIYQAVRAEGSLTHPEFYREWSRSLDACKDRILSIIESYNAQGKTVAAFGASTKGNVILQWLGLTSGQVAFAIDRSPEKVGRYMVGSGVPIVGEEEGRARMPDLCLVLPYAFRDEFIQHEASAPWRTNGGKFLFPLPKVEIV